MSEQQNFGFGKFVPGFDFLQNLGKGTPQQQALSNLSSWVAPTLNVEELDKRIGELKAVSFWLDQNAKALAATIQALELQRMTLATLKGMNFNMGEITAALQLKPQNKAAAPSKPRDDGTAVGSVAGAATEAVAKARASNKSGPAAGSPGTGKTASGSVVDPLQWWGALTTQFQEIAAGALRDASNNPAVGAARDMASGATKQAMKTAAGMADAARDMAAAKRTAPAGKSARAKTASRKSVPRSR